MRGNVWMHVWMKRKTDSGRELMNEWMKEYIGEGYLKRGAMGESKEMKCTCLCLQGFPNFSQDTKL